MNQENGENFGTLRSPIEASTEEIPKAPLAKILLDNLQQNLPRCGKLDWVVDILSETNVRFDQAEVYSRKVASTLYKLGFRRGHVLYYVTYELAQLYAVQLAVWRLGGAVRGCFQSEPPGEYERQMRESHIQFVMVDADTAQRVSEAISKLEWRINLISVGHKKVNGATSFSEMLLDDGNALPEDIDVDIYKDAVIIPNTSGSTGYPKGAVHTHFTIVAALSSKLKFVSNATTIMTPMSNFTIGSYLTNLVCLYDGTTAVHVGRFDTKNYLQHLEKYKPTNLIVFPYLASWLVRCPEIDSMDLSFLKEVTIGGSVLDPMTAKMFIARVPNIKLTQVYAMTETLLITSTNVSSKRDGEQQLVYNKNDGDEFLSSGKVAPMVEVKVVEMGTDRTVGPNVRGAILVKAPTIMLGYLKKDETCDASRNDEEGWFHTGDIGFYDYEENIYIVDRISFIFKYYMYFVSPSIIESVISEHEAVHAVGVVGIPNPETTNLARAYVSLRPNCTATAEELQQFVAKRLPEPMHLHGGVTFLNELPQNRAGKLDRVALHNLSLQDVEAN